jgi:cobalt-zinc-cadmium efflux system membrane fusion protein
VSQVLDPQSKAMKVRINLDNSEMLLKPDMFAKVMVSNQGAQRHYVCLLQAYCSKMGKVMLCDIQKRQRYEDCTG